MSSVGPTVLLAALAETALASSAVSQGGYGGSEIAADGWYVETCQLAPLAV